MGKYTEEQLKNAVAKSRSISQTLQILNLKPAGGNYATIKNRIKEFNIDSSHFTGQGYLKGKTHNWSKAKPFEEILVENSTYLGGSHKLKKRLLKAGFLERKCYNCQRVKWENQPIPLELEHKNGKRKDHSIENLTLLCPNCHALTTTYRGRNVGKAE